MITGGDTQVICKACEEAPVRDEYKQQAALRCPECDRILFRECQ